MKDNIKSVVVLTLTGFICALIIYLVRSYVWRNYLITYLKKIQYLY